MPLLLLERVEQPPAVVPIVITIWSGCLIYATRVDLIGTHLRLLLRKLGSSKLRNFDCCFCRMDTTHKDKNPTQNRLVRSLRNLETWIKAFLVWTGPYTTIGCETSISYWSTRYTVVWRSTARIVILICAKYAYFGDMHSQAIPKYAYFRNMNSHAILKYAYFQNMHSQGIWEYVYFQNMHSHYVLVCWLPKIVMKSRDCRPLHSTGFPLTKTKTLIVFSRRVQCAKVWCALPIPQA
jgi:hypothetical protein